MGPLSRRTLAALRHDQSGFALIEAVVSSLLLVLVASGVYLGLDAASATSGVNKHRSIASELAQQDQDRMRAMAVGELSNYRDTQPARVGPVTYTVASSASWITDATGSASCTSGQARAHYLRIASSVTWPGMDVKPVTVESVVAPPAGSFGTNLGSLAVQVRDREGNGVPGVGVTLSGPQSYGDTTNELGCVLWGYLPVGNGYAVSVSRMGYVDPKGVAQPSQQVGVVGEATSTVAFDYDLGGWIDVAFETLDRAGGTPVPANGTAISIVSGHWTVPRVLTLATPQTTARSDALYPFPDPYGVYAGACAGASPAAWRQPDQLALVQRGGPADPAVLTLREPPVDLLVTRGGRPVQGATVKLTGTASGCGPLPARTTGADGYLTDRALPYGTYAVCVQATIESTTYAKSGTVSNTVASGVATRDATFDLTAAGTCP